MSAGSAIMLAELHSDFADKLRNKAKNVARLQSDTVVACQTHLQV